jgi:hypothetical protein
MKFKNLILSLSVGTLMIAGGFAATARAQEKGKEGSSDGDGEKVIIRPFLYRDPFWEPYGGYPGFFFYDRSNYSPYLRYKDRLFMLSRDLAGNRRELREHLVEYQADGTISPEERQELRDDRMDVRESIMDIRELRAAYGLPYRRDY